MSALVSIIVPLHNVAHYLPECLDSLRAQTYSNIQVVLVDDGSTDGSAQICDHYAAQDARFSVHHQANAGVAAARNAGLDRACGSHIAFVDSDDVVSPRLIQTLLAADADVAQCAFVAGEEASKTLPATFPVTNRVDDAAPLAREDGIAAPVSSDPVAAVALAPANDGAVAAPAAFTRMTGRDASLALQLDGTGTWGVLWNKLYRASLFEDVRFPQGRQHEDEFVTWRLLWAAGTVATSDEALYFYRQRPGSIMASGVTGKSLDALDALEQRGDFYRSQGDAQLADLSDAVLCYRIARVLAGASKSHSLDQAALAIWRTKRNALVKRLVASPHLPAKKKAALLARRFLPGL